MIHLLQWLAVLVLAALAGKLVSKVRLPSILGWLIVGMLLGPHAIGLLPQSVLDASWYKTVIMWMQCAFELMLGTELVWKELKSFGKGLIVTTLTQSLVHLPLLRSCLRSCSWQRTFPFTLLSFLVESHWPLRPHRRFP